MDPILDILPALVQGSLELRCLALLLVVVVLNRGDGGLSFFYLILFFCNLGSQRVNLRL